MRTFIALDLPSDFAVNIVQVESQISASLDLHVLSTPPAFILSQDQTLVKNL